MYFIFKDINSKDLGVTLLRSPKIKTPDYRRYEQEIPGRHGANIRTEGLTSYTFTMDISVEEKYAVEVLGWLKGRGAFSYYLQPDRYIEVDIQSEIELEYHSPGLYISTFSIYAHEATWYDKDYIDVEVGTHSVINEGTFNAKPIIHIINAGVRYSWDKIQEDTWEEWVNGSSWQDKIGESIDVADITVNDTRIIYNFEEEEYVTIDCNTKEAYMNGVKRNHRLISGYNLPELKPGENTIKTNAPLVIEKKDRWL